MPTHKFLSVLFIVLIHLSVQAQVEQPILDCIKNDTLFWTLPQTTCGPFQSVEVFYSDAEDGSFVSIGTVTDPDVNHFIHEIQDDGFYYIISRYGCPQPTSERSEIVSNLPLSQVYIRGLDVMRDGSVLVRWYPHASSTIIAYVIEKTLVDETRTVILDTVYGELQYLDVTGEAHAHPEYYRVWGITKCFNDTDYPMNAHTTIHLRDSLVFCENYVAMEWTQYSGWGFGGVVENILYLGIDGDPIDAEHSTSGDLNTINVLGLQKNSEYCMQIVSVSDITLDTARSNTVCIIADVLEPLTLFDMQNITVSNGAVDIHWRYSPESDMDQIDLDRSDDGTFMNIWSIDSDLPLDSHQVYQDQTAQTSAQAYQYEMMGLDACGEISSTGVGQTIHLEVNVNDDNSNTIEWTPFALAGRTLHGYTLCKMSGSDVIEMTDLDTTLLTIMEDGSGGASSTCYVLKATHTSVGGSDTLIAYSNVDCLEQKVEIHPPNAFVPDGTNSIFQPFFSFEGSISAYRMTIFDRWGGMLFESNNPNRGWDGNADGVAMPPDVYTYVIEVTQGAEPKQYTTGTVLLIR